jgi:hypothetical protein
LSAAVHPSGARLDAVATGDADADAVAHVTVCAECRAYVARLREELAEFAGNEGRAADAFAAQVAASRHAAVSRRRASWWAAAAVPVVALAACVVLFVRAPRPGPVLDTPSPPSEGPIRFKGGPQIAVIVQRDGAQVRHTGSLQVAAGDRIRLELALDHDGEVTAGVLTESGDWAVLEVPTFLSAGTHFSERSVAFDGTVEDGWVVVGPPDAVERARRTRDFSAVGAVRVLAAR